MENGHPFIIYVSGNNGSGKTTVGRALARELGWLHLPEEKFDTTYLKDLFAKQNRWAFEAQTHFLLFKADLIKRACMGTVPAIIDRSPYEDAQVFARYFYEMGHMDRRSFKTYQDLYTQILRDLPEPNAIIFCECSQKTLQSRVATRGRDYEELYPRGHINTLNGFYQNWLLRMYRDFPERLFKIDTELNDCRVENDTTRRAAADLMYLLNEYKLQLELFLDSTDASGLLPLDPKPVHSAGYTGLISPFRPIPTENKRTVKRRPQLYIAAPFTGKASAPERVMQSHVSSFDFVIPIAAHGIISDPQYRTFLEELDNLAHSCGFDTILPHRDVNKWGERVLTSEQAAIECTKHVFSSDAMLAVAGTSLGAHYEIGIAVGYGIPVVVLESDSLEIGFIAAGMAAVTGISKISFGSTADLKQRLSFKLNDLASKLQG